MNLIGARRRAAAIPHGDDNPSTSTAVPVMTSNTAPSGEAKASSEFDSQWKAYQAFDSSTVWAWSSVANMAIPSYLQYKFDAVIAINKYQVIATSTDAYRPTGWDLLASNTGAFTGEEITLDTVTGGVKNAWHTFPNGTEYLYYRLAISALEGDPVYAEIALLNLIEAQGI